VALAIMRDFSRQSFLGPDSEEVLSSAIVGVVGAGGGGSHIVQQLSHAGVRRYVVADDDTVEDHNLNRLVGATRRDAARAVPKIKIAQRIIRGLNTGVEIHPILGPWQTAIADFRRCHVIVGCVDSFSERDQLEKFCRRFLIPYIDIGMDVHAVGSEFVIAGQVVLSMPGEHCMWCMGLLDEKSIAEEARRYGDAGFNPQVVWPNGVLASTAVGLFMQLITPWHQKHQQSVYLEYNGNSHTVARSNRMTALAGRVCPHFNASERGDSLFGR
jgi:molybdopterin-synthase adenylyltransferase